MQIAYVDKFHITSSHHLYFKQDVAVQFIETFWHVYSEKILTVERRVIKIINSILLGFLDNWNSDELS